MKKTYTIRIKGSGAEMVCQKLTEVQSLAWKNLSQNGDDFSLLKEHVRYGKEEGIGEDAYLGEWTELDGLCHIHGCSIMSGNLEILDEDDEELGSVDLDDLDMKYEVSYAEVELEHGAYFVARSDEDGQFFEANIKLDEDETPDPADFTIRAVCLFDESIVTGVDYKGKPLKNAEVFDQETSGWNAEIRWVEEEQQ